MALLDGAFGSPAALMNTIKKSVPISFASFAIIVSMKGNSFNIGAEGQLALGAIGATLAGALIPPKSSHNSIQEIEEKARCKEHQHDRHRKNPENPE